MFIMYSIMDNIVNIQIEKTARRYASQIQGHVTYLLETEKGTLELFLKSYLDKNPILCKFFLSKIDFLFWLLDKSQPSPLKDFPLIHSKNFHSFVI